MLIDYIKELDAHYYMGVFGNRLPAAFVRGEGMRLFDSAGKSYKDFLAGIAVNALGYSDVQFKDAIKKQVDLLIHTSNYFYNEQQARLAEALCTKTGFDKVFFGNSGAEANECALKLALKRGNDRGIATPNVVALRHSFHGRTLSTLAITGKSGIGDSYQPPALSVRFIDGDDADGARQAIDENTCGVILEVIQGEGGVCPLDPAFVEEIRRLCDARDALLIIDEVQSGMGRTGKFLAQEYYGVKGDVTTLAKSLGNGLPIGACLATDAAAATFGPGDHGSTFGGNHLACVAGLYMCQAIDDDMLAHISKIGAYFRQQLEAFAERHTDQVREVRGKGLFLGMQLREPLDAHDVMTKLFDRGFIIGTAGMNTLRFLPPYIVGETDIEELLEALEAVLGGTN